MDKKKLQEFLAKLQEMATELKETESTEIDTQEVSVVKKTAVTAYENGISTMSLSGEEQEDTTVSVGNSGEYTEYIKIKLSNGQEIAANKYFTLSPGDYIIVEVDYLGLVSNKIYERRAELTFYERTRMGRDACSVYSLNNNEYYGDIQGVNNFYKIDLYELYSLYGTASFKFVANGSGLSSAFIYNVLVYNFLTDDGIYKSNKIYNDNLLPVIKQYDVTDLVQVNCYIKDGINTVTFISFDADDYILPIHIGHVYKYGSGGNYCGLNWRLNLDRKLTVSADDTKKTTKYIYIDEVGDKYTFTEKYYYYNDTGDRVFVDKDTINVGVDGELTYEGKNIYTYQSCNGYTLIPEIDDYINSELIDQRQEEYAQIEDYILQAEPSLKSYVKVAASSGEIIGRLSSLTKSNYEEFISGITSTSENIILTESQAIQLKSLYLSKGQQESQEDQLDVQLEQYDLQKAQLENQKNQLLFQVNRQIPQQKTQFEYTKQLATALYENLDEPIEFDNVSSSDESEAKVREQIAYQNADENLDIIDEQKPYITEQINCLSDSINEISTLKNLINQQKTSLNEQNTFIQSQIDYIISQARSNLNLIKDAFIVYFRQKAQLELLERQMPVNYIQDSNGVISGFNREGNLVMLFDAYGNDVTIAYNADNLITGIYSGDVQKFSFVYADGILQSITDSRGRTVKYSYDAERLSSVTFADGRTLKFEYYSNLVENITSGSGLQTHISYDLMRRISAIKNGAMPLTISKVDNVLSQDYSELISEYKISYSSTAITEQNTTITDNEGNYQKIEFESGYNIKKQETHDNEGRVEIINYTYTTSGGKEITSKRQINAETPVTITKKYNEINQLVYEISDWQALNASSREKSRTDYSYDVNNHLVKAITVKTIEISGEEETHTSVSNYSYNAQGKMILSESYVEGEELTSGKSYEERVYDENGNLLKTISWNSLDASSKFYKESSYSENGQIIADMDETGTKSAEYDYVSGTNVVNSIKYANGGQFAYGRNPQNFEISSVSQSTEDGEANVTDIIRSRGLPVEVKSGDTEIGYEYDCKGRKTKVEINGVEQVAYSYTGYSVDGSAITYGTTTQTLADGTVVVCEKTGTELSNGRVTINEKVTVGNSVILSTLYTVKGLVSEITDSISGVTSYTYDSYDNVVKVQTVNNSQTQLTEDYSYNAYGDLSQKTISGEVSQAYTYAYKTNAARDLNYVGYETYKFCPLTDVNGRNKGREVFDGENKIAGEYITYCKVGDHATNMPASVWYANGTSINDSIKYKYDKSGNISEITRNGHIVARYKYDSLNRLTREDNKALNKTVTFTYDINGNITERCEYAYTTKDGEELSELICTHYGYDYDGDKLITYHGSGITYNALGNPTNYRGNAITWQYGKRLVQYGTTAFAYNGAGRRVSKGNITFTYDSEGRLLKQSNGLEFIYDNSGVIGVKYNNAQYFYRRDAQGNIIAIIDNNGNIVVQYNYDAWGNHKVLNASGIEIVTVNDIGNLNPFRYRGYYYDTETGLYYLQTRYYDPVVGRFISRDSVEYADPESINGINLYAYCGNNPVMHSDPYGTTEWWEWLIAGFIVIGLVVGSVLTGGAVAAVFAGAAIGGAISYGTQAISGTLNWGQFVLDIGVGAITGLIGASGVSKAAATVMGGLIGSGSSIASDLINGQPVSWEKAAISGVIGIGAGFLGGAGVKNIKGLAESGKFLGASTNMPGITAFLLKNSKTFLLSAQHAVFVKAMAYYAGGTVLNYIAGLFI